MTYSVKEIFYTLQGEGGQAGCAAVFLRFAGCNLWTGLEKDRAQAVCQFCDTDFVGTNGTLGGKYKTAIELVEVIDREWPAGYSESKLVVCTGGEPLLQLDDALIRELHDHGFRIAVETNGTITAPSGIDWICVSPKSDAPLNQDHGQEIKLVYPQKNVRPELFENLNFKHFFLQPMDGPDQATNIALTIQYCMNHPKWRLSLQSHKLTGIR
ncbi:7-carboxy-7-deazaguanine synthase [Orrella sp. NBD-18]|uniref:7-carboxy-7-deazaguanine synthase n=1 Tax=Sheuella amnicola TaxID=2707330 RepID=A0A6B2QXX5_9BURK|nr:7-carboxy-7-deazaguanine synthase [Sheuella amnicola]NDY82832.1 7-carboxy-7-deazaguanine synthase [Sheuella amnicola]HBI84429.1 7-carboxy-7-deazaguanine synthase [Alcaligenaceae bacterium]